LRILSLSAYEAQSHRYWQDSLERLFPSWYWRRLSLPPRHFSWRVRGNPLYWALEQREVLEGEFDLLVATSMVDLATLRGLVPALTHLPSVYYFHENQFAYPQQQQQQGLLEAQMVSIYGALAADRVLFNSAYNRESFLNGCDELMRQLPDYVPAGLSARVQARSAVLPVPLRLDVVRQADPAWPGQAGDYPQRPLRLVWLGRFEFDKNAGGLCRLLQVLERRGLEYELAVVGQQFRDSPPVFDEIRDTYAHRLVSWGFVERTADYYGLLQGADIVLSTALHEFQGLAVLEAVAAGCLPVVPRRLSYPEIYPAACCYCSSPEAPESEAQAAAELVLRHARDLQASVACTADISRYDGRFLVECYQREFEALLDDPG